MHPLLADIEKVKVGSTDFHKHLNSYINYQCESMPNMYKISIGNAQK